MAAKKQIESKKFTNRMKKKLLSVFLIAGGLLLFLSIILIKTNTSKGEDYSKAVYNNFTYDSRTIPARRGDITDRNGTILAYSTKVYNMIIDAKVILSDEDYRKPTVAALEKYFPDLDIKEVDTYLDDNEQKTSNRSSYKRFLMELTADDIADFEEAMSDKKSNIKGVWFEEEYKRTYPFNTLASDMLGFASEANGGELGIESYYESYLAGIDGREYGYIDNSAYSSHVIAPVNGDTVVSTIDYNIQNIIEKAIKDFNDEYGSESTAVMVMDPNSGEILGMADYPNFNLNDPRDLSGVYTEEELGAMTDKERVEALFDVWSNYCVSSIYEPGSVFKTLTVAEALEEDVYNLKDVFTCDGVGIYNSAKILCHGGDGHGDLTLAGTLTESCNDALMQIGMGLGVPTFTRYFNVFQLGSKTGIDLPSEENGLLIKAEDMMDVDLATNSFGQNINVTMTQMISTYASLINGGSYYQPHTVKEIQNSSGETVEKIQPALVTKTVSEDTSKTIREMLRAVVDYGTGGYTYLEGYSIGGKTGTAEKQPRDKKNYVVSFMGFAPAEDPEVLIYVVVDSPKADDFDSSWAAQVISKQIFQELLPYMGIMADNPDYNVEFSLDAEKMTPVVKREYVASKPETTLPDEQPADSSEAPTQEAETEGEGDENQDNPEETTPAPDALPEETTVAETPPEESPPE